MPAVQCEGAISAAEKLWEKQPEHQESFMMPNTDREEEKGGLVSYTCQFCKETFGRGTELSLHYVQNHTDEVGSEE
jgi:hypothetical protein